MRLENAAPEMTQPFRRVDQLILATRSVTHQMDDGSKTCIRCGRIRLAELLLTKVDFKIRVVFHYHLPRLPESSDGGQNLGKTNVFDPPSMKGSAQFENGQSSFNRRRHDQLNDFHPHDILPDSIATTPRLVAGARLVSVDDDANHEEEGPCWPAARRFFNAGSGGDRAMRIRPLGRAANAIIAT